MSACLDFAGHAVQLFLQAWNKGFARRGVALGFGDDGEHRIFAAAELWVVRREDRVDTLGSPAMATVSAAAVALP